MFTYIIAMELVRSGLDSRCILMHFQHYILSQGLEMLCKDIDELIMIPVHQVHKTNFAG
jgi:hypothetical protein